MNPFKRNKLAPQTMIHVAGRPGEITEITIVAATPEIGIKLFEHTVGYITVAQEILRKNMRNALLTKEGIA